MTILYSAPIGFDNYLNEIKRDIAALEDVMRVEGIAFTPSSGEIGDDWEELDFYCEELIAILASHGISAYADGYAGMFFIEREEA